MRHGRPLSECHEPERVWYPQRSVDFATMETDAAIRRYEALHKDRPYHDGTGTSWAQEPVDQFGALTHPYHFQDGLNIWVSSVDLSPGDKFLTDSNAPLSKGGDDVGHTP